jgi:ATP-dependent protease ClpP protease subunit
MVEQSKDEVNLYIFGTIGTENYWSNNDTDNTASTFTSDFLYCESKYKKINVIINSLGGYVYQGNAICNLISQSKREVHTYNQGIAASMGALILMSGHKVFVAKNSVTMFHSPSSIAMGNVEDLKQSIEELEAATEGFVEILATKSQKTKEEIKASYFDCKDHWVSASSMVDLNFAELSPTTAFFPKAIKSIKVEDLDTIDKNYSQVASCYAELDALDIEEILNQDSNNQTITKMNKEELALSLGLPQDASEEQIKAKISEIKEKAEANSKPKEGDGKGSPQSNQSSLTTEDKATMKADLKKEIMEELSAAAATGVKVQDGGKAPETLDVTPKSPEQVLEANYNKFEY